MSVSTFIPAASASSTLKAGVLQASGASAADTEGYLYRGEWASSASFPVVQRTATSGSWYEELGSGGSGVPAHLDWIECVAWRAGRTYVQYSVVISPANSLLYVKTTAGSITSNTDPSADIAPPGNWTLLTNTNGPAFSTTGNLIVQAVGCDGSQPAQIQWLTDRFGGVSAQLSGRPANGSGTDDANLRVNGGVSAEGLYIQNSINHLEDPAAGTGLASFQLGKDYWFPLGVPTATTPGAARPAKYGGGVFPAYVAGQSTIYTTASDPTSLVLLSRTGTGGGVAGVLSVPLLLKLGAYFTAQSIDVATGGVLAADTGTFQWLIVNPDW